MTTFCNKETGKAELAPGCGTGQEEGGAKISYNTPWIHQGSVQVAGPNGMWGREKEIPRSWKNTFGKIIFISFSCPPLLLLASP